MTQPIADTVDRTALIRFEAGDEQSFQSAAEYVRGLVLQISVGPGLEEQPAAQAALATAVNVGARCFQGGVHVKLASDPLLDTGWTSGRSGSDVVALYGGRVVSDLDPDLPTLTIAAPMETVGRPLLHCVSSGWAGGVLTSVCPNLAAGAITPAGVLAAAIGVSEMFQRALGDVEAARRDVVISLWQPEVDWQDADEGPDLTHLPRSVWLLGLGHLGQAYAWTLGLLPYANPNEVDVGLVDFDKVVAGNHSTQVLVQSKDDIAVRKTRVVAARLESLGFRTRLVERAFDQDFHPAQEGGAIREEPPIALAGFDDPAPRRLLGHAGFNLVVDAGLGDGPQDYLDMVVYSFPDAGDPAEAFKERPKPSRGLPTAYEQEIARQVAAGADEPAARCGILEIAGVTVGAAFVGMIASTLVLADVLRRLHGGHGYRTNMLDLREPHHRAAFPAERPSWTVIPATAETAQRREDREDA